MKRKYFILLIVFLVLTITGYGLYRLALPSAIYYSAGWIIVVLALLIVGNSLIAKVFNNKLPWLQFGRKRLFSQLGIGILYSLVIINLAYFIFKIAFTNEPPIASQLIVTNAYGLVIFIPIFCVYFSLHFLKHWEQSALETERFKKETLKSQLDNLKNHLDPHFLFNNLNILSSLIDYDKNESKKFLDKFADVYRALLKTKDEDLITLEEELAFIDAYVYLLKTRFEENIQVNIAVEGDAIFKMLPPLTIQLLIENAIKHNVISEKRPLVINIATHGNELEVSNTLFEKPKGSDALVGSGLANIKTRYQFFSNAVVRIEKNADQFCVAVPLLEVETI